MHIKYRSPLSMAKVESLISGHVPKRRTAVTRFPCFFKELSFARIAQRRYKKQQTRQKLACGSRLACSAHWCRVASCRDTKKKIAGDVAVIVAVSVKTPSSYAAGCGALLVCTCWQCSQRSAQQMRCPQTISRPTWSRVVMGHVIVTCTFYAML